jgi:hypothetical protein
MKNIPWIADSPLLLILALSASLIATSVHAAPNPLVFKINRMVSFAADPNSTDYDGCSFEKNGTFTVITPNISSPDQLVAVTYARPPGDANLVRPDLYFCEDGQVYNLKLSELAHDSSAYRQVSGQLPSSTARIGEEFTVDQSQDMNASASAPGCTMRAGGAVEILKVFSDGTAKIEYDAPPMDMSWIHSNSHYCDPGEYEDVKVSSLTNKPQQFTLSSDPYPLPQLNAAAAAAN